MFKANEKAMKRDQIKETLAKCASLVGEKMNFYTPRVGKSANKIILPARSSTPVS
jgi:hypothetical protein